MQQRRRLRTVGYSSTMKPKTFLKLHLCIFLYCLDLTRYFLSINNSTRAWVAYNNDCLFSNYCLHKTNMAGQSFDCVPRWQQQHKNFKPTSKPLLPHWVGLLLLYYVLGRCRQHAAQPNDCRAAPPSSCKDTNWKTSSHYILLRLLLHYLSICRIHEKVENVGASRLSINFPQFLMT